LAAYSTPKTSKLDLKGLLLSEALRGRRRKGKEGSKGEGRGGGKREEERGEREGRKGGEEERREGEKGTGEREEDGPSHLAYPNCAPPPVSLVTLSKNVATGGAD